MLKGAPLVSAAETDPPSLEGFERYAVYYAPEPEEPLARFGEGWLGRGQDGAERPRAALDGLPEPQEALTVDARRYGLHGTIKAPFVLADGATVAEMDAALMRYAAGRPAVAAPPLRISGGLGFTSLRPSGPSPALNALAAGVIAQFARFGAKPSEQSLAKRRAAGLSIRQEAYLAAYGYPWVLEDFHFHVTLTRRLSPEAGAAVRDALARPLAPVLEASAFRIASLCLFGDPGGGAPFRLLRRHPLAPPRF